MRDLEGTLDGSGLRIALAVSRFNEAVTEGLLQGALSALRELGVADEHLLVARVPGALELPLVARRLARSRRFDAVLALGAVIKGETDHYEFVCAQATRGCGEAALASDVPVLFGVLTCATPAQAAARSGPDQRNKGAETARAAVRMATLLAALEGATGTQEPRP